MNSGVAVALLSLNAASIAVNVRGWRRSRASWAEAERLANVAGLQARVIGECRELMCEDCTTIVQGHYLRHAYPSVSAVLAEDDDTA